MQEELECCYCTHNVLKAQELYALVLVFAMMIFMVQHFNQQNNWSQIVLPAIKYNQLTGEEESYWPEMWSLEYLKEKKRQAPIAFLFST